MIRHIVFSILFCLPVFTAWSQTSSESISSLVNDVSRYGKSFPQEIVFVHMDNTCYFLGDTIYYKMYVTRSDKRIPSNISGVAYTELINQDGYLVERQTLRLQEGQAFGSFCLPDTLYAGFYELRAYTRWQLNWGSFEHPHTKYAEKWFLRADMANDFFRDYEKLYSRVFPVYDKPKIPGEYSHDMTLRPHQRYFRNKEEKPQAEVGIYPEGGSWVAGIPQRIAFEANGINGEHLEGRLVVYDSQHKPVTEAFTQHRGRGVLEMTAQAGEKYTVQFHWGSSNTTQVRMPQLEERGVSLRVEEKDDTLLLKVLKSGTGVGVLGLTVMMNGVVCHHQVVDKEDLSIPTGSFPAGVAQLTVFGEDGRVWADRLVFIHQANLPQGNIAVSGSGNLYNPLQQVQVDVKGPCQSNISIAIRDQALSDASYDSGNILTEMLLCSQIRGFVEQPDWYFEQDDEEHRRGLDLLMMVQGWRRYRWEDMTKDFIVKEPFEISPIIRGDVSRYSPLEQEDYFYALSMSNFRELLESSEKGNNRISGGASGPILREPLALIDGIRGNSDESDSESDTDEKSEEKSDKTTDNVLNPSEGSHRFMEFLPLKDGVIFYTSSKSDPKDFQSLSSLKEEVTLHAEFVVPSNDEKNSAESNQQTKQGTFGIQAPHAYVPHYLYMEAFKSGQQGDMVTNADEYPTYSIRIRPFYPRYVKPYGFYQTHYPQLRSKESDLSIMDDITQMPELTIGARRNGSRSLDLSKPAMVVDAYDAFNQVIDAGLSPAWYAGSLSYSLEVARLYIGEMGVKRSYQLERRWNGKNISSFLTSHEQTRYNHLRNMQKVSIYTDYAPRLEGDPHYQASNQPTVTLNLEAYPDNAERITYRDRRYILPGYSVAEDFYSPDYSKHRLPEGQKDYRRTLYWNPNLQLDENGQARITFYNNSRTTQISVEAEGQASDGTLLWSK